MALARPQRKSPPYALIIFVFMWLLSTIFAVLFYMQSEKSKVQTAEAKKEIRTWVLEAEKPSYQDVVALVNDDGQRNSSVVSKLAEQIRALQARIDSTAGGESLVQSTKSLVETNGRIDVALKNVGEEATPALIQALTNMQNKVRTESARIRTLETEKTGLVSEIAKARTEYQARDEAAQKSIAETKRLLDSVQTELTSTKAEVESVLTRTSGEKETLAKKFEADLQQRNNALEKVNEGLDKSRAEVMRLRGELAKLKPRLEPTMATLPDGKIIRVTKGTNMVFLNLGKNDRIEPGMTFGVYDPEAKIADTKDKKEPTKASIEVVEVWDNESLARIQTGTAIEGDVFASPIYHRENPRKFHFVVFGDFDLDGDGIYTAVERDRMVRLVQSHGGIVDDEISTLTDFLVLGVMPSASSPAFTPNSDQAKALDATRKTEQKQFDTLVTKAKEFAIPVFNANRFLAMVGYYNNTYVRR